MPDVRPLNRNDARTLWWSNPLRSQYRRRTDLLSRSFQRQLNNEGKDFRMSKMQTLIAATVLSVLAGTAVAQQGANPSPVPESDAPGAGQGTVRQGQTTARDDMNYNTPDQQAENNRGIVGMVLALDVETVGAPGHLSIRRVEPYSPAYFAGIATADQIAAVDGQSLDGKSLSDVVALIRGDVGTTVKLSLNHRGQSREITLTRVEPLPDRSHGRRGMMGMHGGMMGGARRDTGDQNDKGHGMMDHRGSMDR
jgi:membrane-associated protease RseP (regulator of RpoE activity)